MRGVRYFLRNFTARAVQEHLRSQVEDTSGASKLTPKEIELVRFVRDGSLDWGRLLSERPNS
jgi:hypothetical protein